MRVLVGGVDHRDRAVVLDPFVTPPARLRGEVWILHVSRNGVPTA